jgi:RNA polymerase sigma-70 factor (ECF subfamily)
MPTRSTRLQPGAIQLIVDARRTPDRGDSTCRGGRVGPVEVLSVVARSPAPHTCGMTDDARPTAFVHVHDSLVARSTPAFRSQTLSSRISGCGAPAFASNTPPSSMGSDRSGNLQVSSLQVNRDIGPHFEEVVLPHLDAASRLARWLVGNEHDAEDVVQEACLRALRYFRTFSNGNSRAWFLRIVRNTCYDWHSHTRQLPADVFDEKLHSGATSTMDPETLMLHAADTMRIEQAMRELPDRFRELLVLRELEGFSYQELADVLGIPIGSVMSGLSRARHAFRRALEARLKQADRDSDDALAS